MSVNETVTSAFVLGAGLGTRMRPLTDTLPKPLVPLSGRPLIDHVLDRLAQAGVKRAIVNVHYLADSMTRHLAQRTMPRIVISDERAKLLDTGGGVMKALPALGDTAFFIHNSDSVWIERGASVLDTMCATWNAERMDCLMLVAPVSNALGYDGRGDFHMSGDGHLTRVKTASTAPFVFAGVSIAHPRMFQNAPDDAFSLNKLWDRAASSGRLHGMLLDGLWMHVGTPEALSEAEAAIAAAGENK